MGATAFHYVILVTVVILELFSSSIVYLLPGHVGAPPIAEHCENAATFLECSEEFFLEEKFSNHTQEFKDRLNHTFMIYATTSAVRVVVSVGVAIYLCQKHSLRVLMKVDSVALSMYFFPFSTVCDWGCRMWRGL